MKLNVEATPVNPEPSPTNEPVNEPVILVFATNPELLMLVATNAVDVNEDKPVTVVAVLPNVNAVLPSVVTPAVDNIAFDTPPALTFNESPVISIEESSTSTLNAVPEPPAKPAPATEEFNWIPVIPASATFTPPEPTDNVVPSASTATAAVVEPS